MSAISDLVATLNQPAPTGGSNNASAPTAPVSPAPISNSAPTSPAPSMAGPVAPNDYQSAGGNVPNPTSAPSSSTQNWNGQQIPVNDANGKPISTKNLVAYDAQTGNKTFKLPDFAGGGVYTEDTNGNLVNTGHTSYGGEPKVAGSERDDIIPVSLGGTNANAGNIQDVPYPAAGVQDQAETAMAKAVKAGQIEPKAAISKILTQKAQIAGVDPTDNTFKNFISSLPDAFMHNPVFQAAANIGVEGYNLAQGTGEAIEGKPIINPQTPRTILGTQYTPPNPNTPEGFTQTADSALTLGGLAILGMGDEPSANVPETQAATTGEEAATTATKEPIETPKSLKDITPDYNKNMEGEKIINSEGKTQFRVNPAKTLGAKGVNPSMQEFQAAQEVDKLGEMPTKGGYTAKSQFVDNGISNEAENMRTGLQAEDKANPLDVKTEQAKMTQMAHDNLPDDMKAKIDAGKSLPSTKAGQYYQSTLDNAASYDGTREGKLDVRQANDKAYLAARGKYAFGDENLNALDDSNHGLRTDINKDLANTSKTDTSTSLAKQTKLYNARDVLVDKAKTEGSTYFGRHPTQLRLARRLGTTAAITGGIALASGGSISTAAGKVNKAIGGEFNKLRGYTAPPKATKPKAPPKPKKIKL